MSFLNKLTLGKRISLLLATGLIIGIGVYSFLGIRAVNQATEVTLGDRLTTARLVAGYLDDIMGRALSELELAAGGISADMENGSLAADVQRLKETFSRLSLQINSVYIIDNQGKILWAGSGSGTVSGGNINYYPGIDRALEKSGSYISGLVSEPETSAPVILFITPLAIAVQPDISEMLVVTIDVSESSISGFVRPIQLGRTGYVEIVDQNGIVLARTEPGPRLSPFEKSDHSGRFAELITAGKPTQGTCHTCHEPVQKVERKDVLAFVPLSRANWGVIIRQSEDEALAPVYELRRSLIIFGALLAAAASLTVIFTTRDVINRLKMLIVASKKIAAGDLESSLTVTHQDEVGMLAGAFEDMRGKLKLYHGELEQRTKELSYLLNISEMLSHLPDITDLDNALGGVLDKALGIMKEDAGAILLVDEERLSLYCQVNHGLYQKKAPHFSFRLDNGLSSHTVRSGKVVTVEDIRRDRRFDGGELILKDELHGFVSVPIISKEKIMGVLNVGSVEARRFSAEDIRLLEGISMQISAAIENARLHREVQNKDEIRGELLRDMFNIQEEERKRIARELHDETSQVVAGLNASLQAIASLLPQNTDKAKAMLEKAQALSINILDDVHKLIYELRPSLLDDLGLVAAVRWLAESNVEAKGIAVSFKTTGKQKRLTPLIEATLFRVIQEALNNIVRHSGAKNTSIGLQFKKNSIKVQVKDDGQGFDVDEAITSKERPRGLGLVGMKERIAIVKGSIDIRSRQKGDGTEITIDIPLENEVYDAED